MISKVKIVQKAWPNKDGGEGIPIPEAIYIDDQKIEGVCSINVSYKANHLPLVSVELIESSLERELEGQVEMFVMLNGKRYKLVPQEKETSHE